MLVQFLVLAALLVAIVGLLCDAVSQRRLLRALQAHVADSDRQRVDGLHDARESLQDCELKLTARIDRLQRLVQDQGWRDSMMLTRFDWRKPSDRG